MRFQNITLLGTSHIAAQSIASIEQHFRVNPPEMICLELDRERFHALLHGHREGPKLKDIKHIGWKGYLFAKLGHWAEHQLGSSVGIQPGEEMLTAYRLAKTHHSKIALIDQPIRITLRRLHIPWKERLRFVWDILRSPFAKKARFDLSTVPSTEVINGLLREVQAHYPSIYRTLIEERDIYMAKKLHALSVSYPTISILAIVGAGHVPGIMRYIRMYADREYF